MSTIPPRFMHELRDRLSLSEVIGRRVKLTRAGRTELDRETAQWRNATSIVAGFLTPAKSTT